MIKKTLCSLLLAVLCGGMVGPAVSAENDHRYISIRNTDSSWVQGVCSLVFRLDNGGDGTFNNLMVNLQLTDKSGAVLEKELLMFSRLAIAAQLAQPFRQLNSAVMRLKIQPTS